jgi:hypothetical protein
LLGGDPAPPDSFQHRPPPHIRIEATTVAIEFTPGKTDFIDWSDTSLIRRDGVTGHPVWDAFRPPKPFAPGRDPSELIDRYAIDHMRINILETAPDLDGDGTGDLVFALANNPAILAVSGEDGSMLWSNVAELDGPGGAALPAPTSPATRTGRVLGAPAVADVDHDGTLDLPVRHANSFTRPGSAPLPAGDDRLARISGRDGRVLWDINVILPLAIVRLAAGRRLWSIRTLMALPVAVADPLSAYQIIEPLLPEHPDAMISSPWHLFVIATLAGTPIVACMMLVGWSVIRRRWRPLAMLVGLTILASLAIAAVWLWSDMRAMSAIEHYAWSGWYTVLMPGAFVVGVLALIAGFARGIFRRLRRREGQVWAPSV